MRTSPGEALVFASGRLSRAASSKMVERLKCCAPEFCESHVEDLRLPIDERSTMSVLVRCVNGS